MFRKLAILGMACTAMSALTVGIASAADPEATESPKCCKTAKNTADAPPPKIEKATEGTASTGSAITTKVTKSSVTGDGCEPPKVC